MTIEYRKSLTELNIILNYMNILYLKKIPTKFITFVEKNMDKTYIPNIDKNISIDKQRLNEDTKVLLSLIYRNYWCDNDIKETLIKEDIIAKTKYEKEMQEKYNPDNIFKNKQEKICENENLPIKVENESFFKKIIKYIKRLFTK